MRLPGWAVALLLAAGAAWFAWLNLGERTTLSLGLVRFYRVPLSWLVLGAFLLGMLAMFLLGLRHDREVRRVLEEREAGAPRAARPVPDDPTGVAM